jgi:hypothetical protein
MPLTIINGPFIQAGEALSDVIDCSPGRLVRLTMPGAWTSALLSFQISTDNILYNNLYTHDGQEVAIPVQPGAGIIFPEGLMAGISFIKFRSGRAGHDVNQAELREFAVALLT